jgi:hypothetical protein
MTHVEVLLRYVLKVDSEPEEAVSVLDALLDSGALQEPINEYAVDSVKRLMVDSVEVAKVTKLDHPAPDRAPYRHALEEIAAMECSGRGLNPCPVSIAERALASPAGALQREAGTLRCPRRKG